MRPIDERLSLLSLPNNPVAALLREQLLAAAKRQRDAEARAALSPRADVDPAVVRIDDLSNDGQPQPRSLWLRREERAEDLVHYVGRHAWPVVDHLNLDHRQTVQVSSGE